MKKGRLFKKYRLICAIAFFIMVGVVSLCQNVEAFEYDTVTFSVDYDSAYIKSYIGTETEAKIPDKVLYNEKEYIVKEIATGAFSDRDDIEAVVIPVTVEKVAESAFYNCSTLTDIYYEGSAEQWDNLIILPYRNECLLKATVHFNSTGNLDVLEYMFKDDKTVTIIGSDKDITEIVIPKSINGYTVTEIADNAFSHCTELTKVKMKDGIVKIGDFAFSGCIKLEEIELSGTVSEIGKMCFKNSGIKSIALPESIITIDDYVFYDCQKLTNITLHDRILRIGNYSFYGCKSLIQIELPEKLYSIGDNAFQNCSSLKSFTIPEELNKLGSAPFSGCSNLEIIYVNKNNRKFIAIEGVLFTGDMYELICYPAGKSDTVYKIPEDTRVLGNSSFYSCKNLTGIILSKQASYIEDYVFVDCKGLKEIIIYDRLLDIGDNLFYGCDNLTNIYYYGSIKQWETLIEGKEELFENISVHYDYSSEASVAGDVNNDKIVNAEDALMLLKHAAKISLLTDSKFGIADVNKDNIISSEDALMILKYSARLIGSL